MVADGRGRRVDGGSGRILVSCLFLFRLSPRFVGVHRSFSCSPGAQFVERVGPRLPRRVAGLLASNLQDNERIWFRLT